jgi:lipopolysaccharide transport system ATP-binding protein
MSEIAIRVEGLRKRYKLGEWQRYVALRDVLTNAMKAPFRALRAAGGARSNGTPSKKQGGAKAPHSKGNGEYIWALDGVSLEIKHGEAVGLIGRNGAGKTTLLKILSRITKPTEGRAEIHGRVGSLLEVGTGFHPELTGRENIYLNGAILGMKKVEIDRKFDEIAAFAEVEKFLDTPVKHFSSGMYVRLAFAVAAHLEPEILLVDEVLAVGDAAFQKKCLGKMDEVTRKGRTVVLVSHGMPAVLQLCSRAYLLEAGGIAAQGDPRAVVDRYLGEYLPLTGEVRFAEDGRAENAELLFRAVRVLNREGSPSSHLDLAAGGTIEIEYEVLQPTRSAQVAFELWNSLGVCILSSTDMDNDPESISRVKPAGRYRASCFLDPAYLRAGRYYLSLSASVPGIRLLDEKDQSISFEVVDSGSLEFKLAQDRRGMIRPVLKWKTERNEV